ncbi:cobaltochelatase CobT-related protein [Amycolatopsis taiwanensis]|uniref:Cobaltochelatase subunit CobT n=1 Tax=Amycolatopsis taiwanensis TaxID=342230 RepID=A0A9W6QZ42_9PSEU|nr:cobalt chelatase [Amycolatopsis taiwanensis]GLY66363.1 cobaltochelatase subunit CobT [Amycolatopsis taiwanensis]
MTAAGEPLADRAAARVALHLGALQATTARALARDSQLGFRGGRPHRGKNPIGMLAPHLRLSAEDDLPCLRGAADGFALRTRFSDPEMHLRYRPRGDAAELVFDQLEQFRVESLVPPELLGVAANVRHRVEHWLVANDGSGLTHTSSGLLLQTVAALSWTHITGFPLPALVEEAIEPVRAALAPEFGPRIARISRTRATQSDFAPLAAQFSADIGNLLGGPAGPARRRTSAGQRALADLLRGSGPEGAGTTAIADGQPHIGLDEYRVYTTVHDRERPVVELVRLVQQKEFRAQLDVLIRRAGLNRSRMLRGLTASLATVATHGWNHDLDTGYIDGRRLASLVVSPNETRIFRDTATVHTTDVNVTFLLDCSGSMKRHVPLTAVLVDALARVLDELDIETEVLGFTTGAWHGGRSRRDWSRAGRPAAPGRLNDRLHLVFKDAGTSWRSARRGIAGLFKADLFREGLAGEAVRWAADRLLARPAGRNILVVVSDGGPADSATASSNPEGFLEADLARAVESAEQTGVEVLALSLGMDLSRYFSRSLVLPATARVDQAMVDEVIEAFAGQRPAYRPTPGAQSNRVIPVG